MRVCSRRALSTEPQTRLIALNSDSTVQPAVSPYAVMVARKIVMAYFVGLP